MEKKFEIRINVNSGYCWGEGMSAEAHKAFCDEMQSIVEKLGFKFEAPSHGSAATAHKGDSGLYLHPMEVSGRTTLEEYEALEAAMKKSNKFTVTRAQLGEEVIMLNDDEYIAQYLAPHKDEFIEYFKTHAKDLQDYGIIDYAMFWAQENAPKRPYSYWGTTRPGTCSEDIEVKYICQLYNDWVCPMPAYFKNRLNEIEDEDMKNLAVAIIKKFPEYIWKVPASSSGKYHPVQDAGDGGLIRHMACTAYIMNCLLAIDCNKNRFSSTERDCMRIAALVHDGRKNGEKDCGCTKHEHPLWMADAVLAMKDEFLYLNKEIDLIAELISSHMGQWNTREGCVTLPLPINEMQRLVHEADYLASRKPMTMDMEAL